MQGIKTFFKGYPLCHCGFGFLVLSGGCAVKLNKCYNASVMFSKPMVSACHTHNLDPKHCSCILVKGMANQSNYGSIPNSENDETEAFFDNQKQSNKIASNCNWRVPYFVIAAVLVVYPFHSLTSKSLVHANNFGWVPTDDLGIQVVSREPDALPSAIWGSKRDGPLPTNSWYLVGCSSYFANMRLSTRSSNRNPLECSIPSCRKSRRIVTCLYSSLHCRYGGCR